MDYGINYYKLAYAHTLITQGEALFLAANDDQEINTPNGFFPGPGAIVHALKCSTNKLPVIAGKPNSFAIDYLVGTYGLKKEECLMFGDKLSLDIKFACDSGIDSCLLLSGSSTEGELKIASGFVPNYILDILKF